MTPLAQAWIEVYSGFRCAGLCYTLKNLSIKTRNKCKTVAQKIETFEKWGKIENLKKK